MPRDRAIITLVADNGFSLETSVLRDAVRISKSASFSSEGVLNRSSPVIIFDQSSAIDFTVNFHFLAQGQPQGQGTSGGGNEIFTAADIANVLKGLLSLEFPDYSSGTLPPTTINITLGSGSLFDNYLTVCPRVDIDWGSVIYDANGDPIVAGATCQFLGVELRAVDMREFGGGSIKAYSNLAFT